MTEGGTAMLDAQEALTLAHFAEDGLLPAVIQEQSTRQVLMVGYMDREALRRTLTEGRVVFWSRSRQEYWRKGDTSGHVQHVRGAALDCDADALLVTVEQVGPACHTGAHACFDTHPVDAATSDARTAETGEHP
jgi:phosphoribosyl-AMP cyclohydrolase